MQTWRLKIEGMTCSHCELKVETILKTALPQAKIKVTYANSEAMVSSDSTDFPFKDLKLKLHEAGYTLTQHSEIDPNQKSISLSLRRFCGKRCFCQQRGHIGGMPARDFKVIDILDFFQSPCYDGLGKG